MSDAGGSISLYSPYSVGKFSVLTVLFSAWLPARKLSRLTPLEAIRNTGVLELKKKRSSPILSMIFGLEGELAGNALKAQKKALRTSTLSLTLSFLGFTMMLCMFSLTDLSTKYTYTQRYQHAWDIMVTVKDTDIEELELSEDMRKKKGVQNLTVYQKAETFLSLPDHMFSPELAILGGPESVAKTAVSCSEGNWKIKAPVIILDDASFTEYCRQIGINPRLDGTIILNRIWDSLNSVFRYRKYIPFIKENLTAITLYSTGEGGGVEEIPVLGYTQEMPVLKEQYDDYTLVQFLPLSLWKKTGQIADSAGKDTYIRILAQKR